MFGDLFRFQVPISREFAGQMPEGRDQKINQIQNVIHVYPLDRLDIYFL